MRANAADWFLSDSCGGHFISVTVADLQVHRAEFLIKNVQKLSQTDTDD